MNAVGVILSLWVVFAAVHLVMSSTSARPRLIRRLGEKGFLAFYSAVIIVVFVTMILYYFDHKHAGPLLWDVRGSPLARYASMAFVALGFFFLAISIAPSSAAPTAMTASGNFTAKGLVRVTRHPGFIGFSLFGLGHCLMNGFLGDVIFFAGFAAWPPIGARHQERRKLAAEGREFANFLAETSYVPFAAALRGKQKLVWREINWRAGMIGLLVFGVARFFHGPLFGP